MHTEPLEVRHLLQCRPFGGCLIFSLEHGNGEQLILFHPSFNSPCGHQVPLRQKSINEIGERYYTEPSPFHDTFRLAVPADWMHQNCEVTRAKPVSPMENLIAFVLNPG